MAARSGSRRKSARKKTSGGAGARALERVEAELPPNLKQYSRRVRRDLGRLERRIEDSTRDTRRRLARVLRDVSHQLGRIEAEGEKRWRTLTTRARRDAVQLLRRLEKAIAPPPGRSRRKRASSRKTRSRKTGATRTREAGTPQGPDTDTTPAG